jgi:UDP-glucose 4-epimerase
MNIINELKNPHNDKKVVIVTGGCGFIGKHLINKLIKGNYFPVIIDDLSNSSLKSIKKYRHQILFIKQSILDLKGIENKLMQLNPYAIIHLAALHYIPYCIKYPQKTKEINVQGTKILLALAKNLKIDKFIFASSAAVYSPAERAHKETDKLKGIDIYGKTKISAEKLIRYFSNAHLLRNYHQTNEQIRTYTFRFPAEQCRPKPVRPHRNSSRLKFPAGCTQRESDD